MKEANKPWRKRLAGFLHGIRFRLMAWFVAVLALVLVLFSVFVYTRTAQDLHTATVNRLAVKTENLERLFRFEGMGSIQDARQVLPGLVVGGISLVQEDEVLVVVGSDGQWVARMGPVSDDDITRMVGVARDAYLTIQTQASDQALQPVMRNYSFVSTTTHENQDYLFLITPFTSRNTVTGYMLLGRPSDPTHQLPALLATLALASLAIVLGSAAAWYWLAGRVLRPVHVITQTARRISDTDLSLRLGLDSPDELGELAGTLDGMLARLEAAFTRQRQFTADASHELRTPLTIIGLEAGRALEQRRKVDEYERVLRTIQHENDHMSRLVADLLTLARLDAGQTRLQSEDVDLSDVALDVVERLAPLAAQKNIRLEAGDLPEATVVGDRPALVQVVRNLAENAIKYAPAESGHVRISAGCEEKGAYVEIEDNGPGIAAEDLPHVFERFYRADKARSRDGDGNDPGGSGLGLAIVKGLAEAHGGEVCVTSQPGQGTTFRVVLPAKE